MNSPKLCNPNHLKILPKAVPWVRIVVSGSITGCWECHVQWNESQEQCLLFYFTFSLQRNFRELNDLMNCVLAVFYIQIINPYWIELILALVNGLEMRGEMIPKGSKFRGLGNLEKREFKEWAEVQYISCRPFQRISCRPLRKKLQDKLGAWRRYLRPKTQN